MNIINKRLFLSLIIILGFIVSFIIKNKIGYTFLFDSAHRYSDFYNVVTIWNTYGLTPSPYICYFPLTYILIKPFFAIDISTGIKNFFTFLLILSPFYFFIFWQGVKGPGLKSKILSFLTLSFLTYPLWFTIDRGNLEILIFIFLSFYIYFYKKNFLIASLLLAISICMKGFPAIFLLLYLSDRKYKKFFFVVILSTFLMLFSFWVLPHGLESNLKMMIANQRLFYDLYVLNDGAYNFGHNLLGVIKFINYGLNLGWSNLQIMPYYNLLIVLLGSLSSIYIVFVEKEFFKKIFAIIICACLLPANSSNYKLMYFLIPTFLFLQKKELDKNDWVFLVFLGLIMIPKNYFPPVYSGVLIDPILMFIVLLFSMIDNTKKYFSIDK